MGQFAESGSPRSLMKGSLCRDTSSSCKLLVAEAGRRREGKQKVHPKEGHRVRASLLTFCDGSPVGGREQVRNANM